MKTNTYLWVLMMSLFIKCTDVNAGLIQSDLFAIGDELTVTDTENGLVWLDLSMTDNMSSIIAATTYPSFRFATRTEYETLLTTSFSHWSNFSLTASYFSPNGSPEQTDATYWNELFGKTHPNQHSVGWLFRDDPTQLQIAGLIQNRIYSNFSHLYLAAEYDPEYWVGWFMVKDAVDVTEPSIVAIFSLSLISLLSLRYMK